MIGPQGHDLVVVYRGVDRESYSCAPECEPRITLGDTPNYFNATLGAVRHAQRSGARRQMIAQSDRAAQRGIARLAACYG